MVRDLTKSMLSFSWAMSLFGVEQLVNTLTPQSPGQPTHKATAAFSAVTEATEAQLGGVLQGAAKAGKQLQGGVVDLMFSFLSLEAFNPSQMMRMTSDIMRQTTGAIGEGFQGRNSGPPPQAGWGHVPPSGTSEAPSQEGWGPMPAH
jgi:hypothetical protein